MGKKGSWFSAIKKVFLPHHKDKLATESDKKSRREKKGLGKLRHGETTSFIPMFREPSSIEKILDEAEREHKLIFRPPTPLEEPGTPPFVTPRVDSPRVPSRRITSPRAASPRTTSPRAVSSRSPRVVSPRATSPRAASPRSGSPKNVQRHEEIYYTPEPTLRYQHDSAIKIQAAYRGYIARRSFRALRGLVRLQGVVRGQNAKRQTVNAMKYMQLLVRVQSQIQSRRIQMLENQARQQAEYRNDKEADSTLSKWSQASEAGNNEDWDDSLLTKEEIEARLQRKAEASVKRERAMAYAHSRQLWRTPPKSAQPGQGDIRANGFAWWWNWLERQLPLTNTPESQGVKNFQLTPPRPHSELNPSPQLSSIHQKQQDFRVDNMGTPTPRSSRSTAFAPTKLMRTPQHRTPPASSPSPSLNLLKHSRARANGADSPFDIALKDDDSLISCPPFSVPNYMVPTVSAKARARANSNPKERYPAGSPSSDKRRLSFPLTQGIGPSKWSKGSLFSGKDSGSQRILDEHQSLQSVGNLSVDSTVSMPAAVGRRPFNRFV